MVSLIEPGDNRARLRPANACAHAPLLTLSSLWPQSAVSCRYRKWEEGVSRMRVRCIKNSGQALPSEYLDKSLGISTMSEFNLTLGKDYIVYTVVFLSGNRLLYYLCDDAYTYYPKNYAAPLFRVIDNSVSRYWRLETYEDRKLTLAILGFDKWVSERYFYDRLTDGEEPEVSIFSDMKNLIDAELDEKAHS